MTAPSILKNLTSKIGSGATPRGGDKVYIEHGVTFIRSQNVIDFHFLREGLVYIDADSAKSLSNVEVMQDDILLNITGDSVARCCIVDGNILPARVNQHVAIIRTNKFNSAKYIFYHLQYLKEHLLSLSEIGATRRALTKDMLELLKVCVPATLAEQQAIAALLSSLDDKIDLLHRQNKTLEALAQTLFRQWFVEEADKNIGALGDIIELSYGKALKEEVRSGTGFPVFGSNGIVGYHSEPLVKGPGIVIGRKGTLGNVFYVMEDFYPIDTTYYIVPKRKPVSPYYEYFLLKSLSFENSDSAVPGLNRDIALSHEIIIQRKDKIESFDAFCRHIFNKMKAIDSQIRTLTKLRDTLLPKLMSGEVRVEFKK